MKKILTMSELKLVWQNDLNLNFIYIITEKQNFWNKNLVL